MGVAIANFITLSLSVLCLLMIVFIALAIFFKRGRFIVLIFLFFILGMWRFIFSLPSYNVDDINFYNDQKIIFQGIVQEPDSRLDHVKLTIESKKIQVHQEWLNVEGRVLVKNSLYPQYDYGDLVQVSCQLYAPQQIEEFSYDKYLARYNIYSTCSFAQIQLLEKNNGNIIIANLLNFKNKISLIINKTIPEPQASFLAGILIGSRKGIPDELLTAFNRTGVTHIIAISGYNISVISVMIMNLCIAMRIPRKKAFWVITILILFFVIITGATAAVIRSAIMGIVVLLAKYLGRKSKINNILALTAVIMLIINPKILLFDAGFQLSYLATIGLIYFVPILEKYFEWLPQKFAIRENLTTTMAAIIWTTPLILSQFGRLSLVAPIVNVLILSFIPLAMLSGFIQVVLGLFSIFCGRIIGYITWLILEYIIIIVKTFSGIKYASIEVNLSLFFTIICYIILLLIVVTRKGHLCGKKVEF